MIFRTKRIGVVTESQRSKEGCEVKLVKCK